MAGRNPSDIDAVISDLFPQPMLANIHMFQLRNERWEVFGEQSNGLLIVTVNDQVVIESKSDIFEQTVPPKSLRCRVR